MHTISQKLAMATDEFGNPRKGYTQEHVTGLYSELFTAVESTKKGREFLRRGGTTEMLVEMYRDRYAERPPAVFPIYEGLMEIVEDLLVTLPSPVEQVAPVVVAPPPAPVVKPLPEPPAALRKLAHLINENIMTRGVKSLKPIQGIVYLHANGTAYEYPFAEFDRQFQEAVSFNLIR